MEYAFVAFPLAPVRRKPRHQREMVNQLLFGEAVQVLREKGELWVKVKSLHDNYEGWMTRTLLTEATRQEAGEKCTTVTSGLLNEIHINGAPMYLPMGANLPGFNGREGSFGKCAYLFSGTSVNRTSEPPGKERLEQLAARWLNAPYLWGGRTILGVDCSGFVQVNYKMMGLDLPRDAWQQAQEGHPLRKLKEAVTGDLAFFDDKDEIVHVGIMLGNDRIIHASGNVRIDPIDKKGIIREDTGKRTHRLKALRRYW